MPLTEIGFVVSLPKSTGFCRGDIGGDLDSDRRVAFDVEKFGFVGAVAVVRIIALCGDLVLPLLLLSSVRLSKSRSRFAVLVAEEYASTHPTCVQWFKIFNNKVLKIGFSLIHLPARALSGSWFVTDNHVASLHKSVRSLI